MLAAIVTGLTLLPWLLRHPSVGQAAARPRWRVVIGAVLASPQLLRHGPGAMLAHARGGLAIDPHLLAVSYKQYGDRAARDVHTDPAGGRLRPGPPGRAVPARPGQRGTADVRHDPDRARADRPGRVLAAPAAPGSSRRSGPAAPSSPWAPRCGSASTSTCRWRWPGTGCGCPPLMPYTWFVRIPGLSSFREADRLAILGLVPAALLAGAAVNWLRYHAKPLLVVVLALGDPGSRLLRARRRSAACRPAIPRLDRADRRRPLRARSWWTCPFGHARRDPGVRLAVLRPGAGDGHRGRPPAGDRLHLAGPAATPSTRSRPTPSTTT